MNKFLEHFMEAVKNDEDIFMVKHENITGFYCRRPCPSADIIYGCEDRTPGLNSEMKPLAIVKREKIVLVDTASYLYSEELPENVSLFTGAKKELERELNEKYFIPWFDAIEVEEKQPEDRDDLRSARRILFGLDEYERPKGITLSSAACFELLTGNVGQDVYKSAFAGKEDLHRKEKAHDDMLRRLITVDKDKAVSASELQFVEAVKGLNARNCKFVTAEFEKNGRTASVRINPRSLIGRLALFYDLCADSFESLKAYSEVRNNLGVDCLTCEDIRSLSYAKDVVYTREVH